MTRREELLNKCKELGLKPNESRNRVNKETGEKYTESTVKDCQKAIQQYYIEKYKAEGSLSPFMLDIMSIDSPMLALQSKDKKLDSIRDTLWEDNNNWLFQEKIDGCRMILCYDTDYGWDFYSRNPSIVDELPTNYRNKLIIPNLNNELLKSFGIKSFILDSEVVPINKEIRPMSDGQIPTADTQLNLVTSILGSLNDLSHKIQETNPLKFMLFDVLKINDDWKINYKFIDRYKTLLNLYPIIKNAGLYEHIDLILTTTQNKHQFYDNIISLGGEGCIAKRIDSLYDTKGKRAGEWIKLKRTVSQSLLMEKVGDTVDAFISGFKEGTKGTNNEGLVGALEFSVYLTDDNNEYILDSEGNPTVHHIATISGITDELRHIISQKDENGTVCLNPTFYGRVAEIDGQDISSKNYRFAHAIFKGWRPDRSSVTCKLMKSILDRLVL